jgi:hypothetical protein
MITFKEYLILAEMSNIPKSQTEIDYPIWVGYKIGSHGPRIKVSNIKGKVNGSDFFSIQFDEEGDIRVTKDSLKSVKISNKSY